MNDSCIEHLPFFLCCTHRVGSYLLRDLINSSGAIEGVCLYSIIGDGEQFETDEDWLSYWEGIPDRWQIDTKKIWGAKFYLTKEVNHYLSLKEVSPLSIKWIWMRRKNKIKQAISQIRAMKTNKWSYLSYEDESTYAMPDIDVQTVNAHALGIYEKDFIWGEFFRENKIEPYVLFYEDLEYEHQWKDTVLSVLDFLEGFRRPDIRVHTEFIKSPSYENIYQDVIMANKNNKINL